MQFERTARLLGERAVEKLRNSRVAVFGIGGVGSYAVEALARAGVGSLLLVDGDVVERSNINRQLIALHSTVGLAKVEVCRARILDICPDTRVETRALWYGPDTQAQAPLAGCDYIIDAVDSVSAKLLLIENAKALHIPILCCMGAGNRLDPMAFRAADISKTSMDPLSRVMRRELRARGITDVRVVYSTEPPRTIEGDARTPASVSFVPSAAGLLLAGEVVRALVGL